MVRVRVTCQGKFGPVWMGDGALIGEGTVLPKQRSTSEERIQHLQAVPSVNLEEVPSGQWGVGGTPPTTKALKTMAAQGQ